MRRKKQIASLVLCLCLVFSLCPQTAAAEGLQSSGFSVQTMGLCEHHPQHTDQCGYTEDSEGAPCTFICEMCGGEEGEGQEPTTWENVIDSAVINVQTLIDALPTAAELESMSQDEQRTVYEQVQTAYNAYNVLIDEQKEQITGAEIFDQLFTVFNDMVNALTVETEGDFGDNNSLHWSLDDGTLTISGEGNMPDLEINDLPWYNNCDSIEHVVIEDGVTSIGINAFFQCSKLTSIIIPKSVTSIGMQAFFQCRALASITIPEGVTSIGMQAFSQCYALTSITIPESVISIENRAFFNCSSLESVTFAESSKLTSIEEETFLGCRALINITIPESVTSIGDAAFSMCAQLESINIPANVVSIGEEAFNTCLRLGNVTFAGNSELTFIGDAAFQLCPFKSIDIPGSVISIGDNAFYMCSLTSLTIPASVTSIGDNAFADLQLTEIIFEGENAPELVGSKAVDSDSLKTIHIPADSTGYGGTNWPKNVTYVDDTNNTYYVLTVVASTGGTASVIDLSGYLVKEGTPVTLTATPDQGYAFTKWNVTAGNVTIQNDTFTMPKGYVAVTAEFKALPSLATPTNLSLTSAEPGKSTATWSTVENASSYSVQLYKDNSAVGSAVPISSGTSYDFTITEAGSYTFGVKAIGDNATYVDSSEEESTALNFYIVIFNTDNSGTIPSQIVANGSKAAKPDTPTRTGYDFDGWYSDNTFAEDSNWDFESNTVTTATTLYAKWTPLTYKVTLETNGGTVSNGNVTGYTYGKGATLPTDVTREGYAFAGWYEDSHFSSSKVTTIGTDATGDKTYYAKWLSTDAGVTSVSVNGVAGNINGMQITVTLPFGTTSLPTDNHTVVITTASNAAKFSIPSTTDNGATWTFTVTAEDGSTTANYTVTVTIAPDPATENRADVNAAKAAVDSHTWTVSQATANTEEAVKAWIEEQLTGLAEIVQNGVSYTVTITNFTAATGGTAADRDGTNGSFAFTVILSKGNDTENIATSTYAEARAETRGVVTASTYHPPYYPVTGITLDQTSLSLEKGSTATLHATVAPTYATNPTVTWSSSDTAVATVDHTGTVTAVGGGTAVITASAGNYSTTCTVTVPTTPSPTALTVTGRTTSSVTLSWDGVEEAEGYTIWYRSEYETEVTRKIIWDGDTTTWTKTCLEPGTKYFFAIRSWVTDADGKYVFSEVSPTQRGTTKPEAAQIQSVTVSNGYVKVRMAGEARGAKRYSICYADSRNGFTENNFLVGIRTSYTVRTMTPQLEPGTYYICVKSYRDLGNSKRIYGDWSNIVRVTVR